MSFLSRLPRSIAIVATLLSAGAVWAQASQCGQFYAGNVAPDYLNAKLANSTRELCYESYGVFHSGLTRTPLWSAEKLTRSALMQAKGLKRENNFHAETRLPGNERAELSDYARSGFDRGHLSPNADFGTKQGQYESFTLANMIPQAPELNRGEWEGVESVVRDLAKKKGTLYVVTGPAFMGDKVKKIGRVMVPSHVWKAVYDPSSNKAGAYWFANTNDAKAEYLSIDELAARIGIQPFPSLPASVRLHKMDLPEPRSYKSRHGGQQSSNYRSSDSTMSMVNNLKRFLR